jgi:hemolysin activation/secretion protein
MVKIQKKALRRLSLSAIIIVMQGIPDVFFVDFALSQTLTPPTLPPIPKEKIPLPQRPPEQPLPLPKPIPAPPLELLPPPSPPEQRPDLPQNVTVTQFEFEGNTAFSNQELSDAIIQFTNRPITFAELLEAEATITKLYTDAGYINSGAVILAGQTLSPKGAVVKIQVIEGGIEEIKVTGTKRLSPAYVRSRLGLATKKPLNQKQLLKALQLLQLDPLIKKISADLSAGSRPEMGILSVKVEEARPFNVEVFADNGRTPSVGSFRRGVRFDQSNLIGIGDTLNLEYANTNGSNAFNLSYAVPVNPRNGKITVSGGFSFTEVIEEPFNVLDIVGDSYFVDLSYRQPVIQTPTQELAVGITASRQESQTLFLDGIPVPSPGTGVGDNGRTRVMALRPFVEWIRRTPQDVLALRSQFNIGLGVLDATVNELPPDGRFFSWRGQAQYVRQFAPDMLFVVRSDLQLSADPLVPLEQFSLGGQQSVRGYRQDVLLTDNGFFASAEMRFPIFRVKKVKGVLQIVPFVDFGIGWDSTGRASTQELEQNTLIGVGVGLQWQMWDRLTARFDWGIPLNAVENNQKSLQEQGLYFSINYSFF